jgi:ribonuclease BN (tRNA processing enzyme)
LTRGESASALVVGGQPYLIDCGYGTFRALAQAEINFMTIGQVFLTHLHDDHFADLAALLGHQWTRSRKDLTTVFGPFGTDKLVAGAVAFNAANARIRMVDEGRPRKLEDAFKGVAVPATDKPTKVYEDERIVVKTVENTHFDDAAKQKMRDRSLSYRIDSATRSVVFSGDTAHSDNLVQLAQGADIFVCEAIDVATTRKAFEAQVAKGAYRDNPERIWKHIVESHTPLEEAGKMATAAKVKILVLNHLVPGALNPADKDSNYIDKITPHFSGKIVVASDQMVL